ncbi:MAG: DUF2922 domain-containing protein [Bacillota bacterium]|jgi:hypothetical protein|nr:DUF2922 domain-containing protein [Bacillota bacterium]
MLTKRLELIFQTAGGGRLRISVADPREDLTPAEVEAAMNTIIAKDIFTSRTGSATAIYGARIVSRDTVDLITA